MAITALSTLNNPRTLIIGAGLVGGALAARLPDATMWSRATGFVLGVESTWGEVDFDIALFCAAIPRMPACEQDPSGTRHINVTQTLHLLEKLTNTGVHSIFLSTDKVFDGTIPHIAPDAPTNPQCEYGRQKVDVENWCKTHEVCVLRLSKVLAPEIPLLDQWQAEWAQGRAVEAFADMTLAPVWIDDVVDAMLTIATERRIGLQQISGAEDISYADLARKLAPDAALVKPISYRDKNIPAYQSPAYTSYTVTVGPARTVDSLLSLWRAAQKPAK